MKKASITFLLLILFNITNAQFSYHCIEREDCDFDEKANEFVNCSTEEESSLFIIDQKATAIHHFTKTNVSIYKIDERVVSDENNTITLKVNSDLGNKYIFVLFLKKNVISVVYTNKKDEVKIIRFKHDGIKSYQ